MASLIYVRNLPAEATEDDIRRVLEHHGRIIDVEFVPDARENTDRKVAMIKLDLPHYDAELIAEKFNGRIVRGERISMYATMHD